MPKHLISPKSALALSIAMSASILWSSFGFAQSAPDGYPKNRHIRFITPYTPGGSTDALARILGDGFSSIVGQTVVVEGRPGAGGSISTTFVAKSDPDGYTLLVADVGPLVISRSVYARLPSDPVKELVPIACATTTYLGLMVGADSPAKTVREFVDLAKREPGKLTYSSSGIGTIIQMGTELFGHRADITMTHVPFRGGAPATLAVLQGEVSMGFMNMPTAIQYIKSGQVRALGVASLTPSALAPDVPTIASQGYPGFQVGVWHAVMAPASTPPALVDYLRAKMKETLASPAVRKHLASQGHDLLDLNTEQCSALIRDESAIWSDVATKRNIKVN